MNEAPQALVSAVIAYGAQYGFDRVPLGLVLAQSALESAYWTSDVYRNGNNAFGLRLASVRDTPAVGVYAGHAQYLNLQDSAMDYWDRQSAFGIPNTSDPSAYVAATVDSGYATSPNYGASWLDVDRDRFDGFTPSVYAGAGASVVLLGVLLAALASNYQPSR